MSFKYGVYVLVLILTIAAGASLYHLKATIKETTFFPVDRDRLLAALSESTPYVFTRTMREGDSGDDVRALEEHLALWGHYGSTTVTGTYTRDVTIAVKRFQRTQGLNRTGRVDTQTLPVLNARVAAMYTRESSSTIPVITSPLTAQGTVGTPFTYQITATNNPTSYAAATLVDGVWMIAPGLTGNASTGVISGTPTQAGTFTINIRATNAAGTGSATLTLTISSSTSATPIPVITSDATITTTKGTAFSYQITATNNPTSYGVSPYPPAPGLQGSTATGLIYGTTTQAGTYTARVRALNSAGTGYATITILVKESVVATNGTCGSSHLQTFSTAPTTNLCTTGTASTVSGTGPWTWSCAGSNGGTTAQCSAEKTPTLQVPTITSPLTAQGTVGTLFTYQITATNNPTSYAAATLVDGVWMIAPGLTGNASTGVISGTPTQAGTFTINIRATNAAGTGSATLMLTVASATSKDTTATTTATAVNGMCGSSNLQSFTSTPTTNLCIAGATSSVSGTGPWTWSCAGLNGGTIASCSAQKSLVTATTSSVTIAPLQLADLVYLNVQAYYPRVSAGSGTYVSAAQGGGATGTITAGPTVVNNVRWWNVNFSKGTDGWVPEISSLLPALRRVSDAGGYYATPTSTKPGIAFSAYPYSVQSGGTTTLQWEGTNATSCTASWGSVGVKGTFVTPKLYATTTYTINCTDGKNTSRTKKVVIGMGFAKPKVAILNYGPVHSSSTLQKTFSRFNLGIFGYSGTNAQTVAAIKNIRALNPNIRLGKYAIAIEERLTGDNNGYPTINTELDSNNWWLRNASGALTTWTTQYATWEINMTKWGGVNKWGDSYPVLAAKVHARDKFAHIDIDYLFKDNFYADSINGQQIPANWKYDGVNRTILPITVGGIKYLGDPEVGTEFRKGYIEYFSNMRREIPGLQIMGNGGDGINANEVKGLAYPEYIYQFEGNFMECVIGKSYSRETWRSTAATSTNVGWNEIMMRYRNAMKYTKDPHDVIFGVCRANDPLRPDTTLAERDMMRYGLASAMLDNGWFKYSPGAYSDSSMWYDEYDAPMGKPTQAPPTSPTFNGVYTRTYENGMVVVNPRKDTSVTITIPPGYRRLLGTQDPAINNGQPVTSLTMAPRSGILLVKQ